MSSPKNIEIADFNYDLPDERIAKFPLKDRGKLRQTSTSAICWA